MAQGELTTASLRTCHSQPPLHNIRLLVDNEDRLIDIQMYPHIEGALARGWSISSVSYNMSESEEIKCRETTILIMNNRSLDLERISIHIDARDSDLNRTKIASENFMFIFEQTQDPTTEGNAEGTTDTGSTADTSTTAATTADTTDQPPEIANPQSNQQERGTIAAATVATVLGVLFGISVVLIVLLIVARNTRKTAHGDVEAHHDPEMKPPHVPQLLPPQFQLHHHPELQGGEGQRVDLQRDLQERPHRGRGKMPRSTSLPEAFLVRREG